MLTLFALLSGFANAPPALSARWQKAAARVTMGAAHTALHLVVAASVAWAATRLAAFADGFGYVTVVVALVALVGAWSSATALGLYLWLAMLLLRTHGTEVFSAIREERYKNFLRLHVSSDGRLTVYALGIDKPAKRWLLTAKSTTPDASYLRPTAGDEIHIKIIDQITFAAAHSSPT